MKFLRIKDVVEKTGLGKSTIWLWAGDGRFPKPKKISPRVTVWLSDELDLWLEKQVNINEESLNEL